VLSSEVPIVVKILKKIRKVFLKKKEADQARNSGSLEGLALGKGPGLAIAGSDEE